MFYFINKLIKEKEKNMIPEISNQEQLMQEIDNYNSCGWKTNDPTTDELTNLFLSVNDKILERSMEVAHHRQMLTAFAQRIKDEFPDNKEIGKMATKISHFLWSCARNCRKSTFTIIK